MFSVLAYLVIGGALLSIWRHGARPEQLAALTLAGSTFADLAYHALLGAARYASIDPVRSAAYATEQLEVPMDMRSIPDMDSVRLRLAAVVDEIGAMCREIGIRTTGLPTPSAPVEIREDPRDPVQVAERLYADRRRRARQFPATLFGEPAWDILLDLFIATERGRDISVTSACIAADVPSTTGLRWLHILEAEGLVTSEADSHDGRRRFIRLTRDGYARMKAYLDAGIDTARRPRRTAAKEAGFFADWL